MPTLDLNLNSTWGETLTASKRNNLTSTTRIALN